MKNIKKSMLIAILTVIMITIFCQIPINSYAMSVEGILQKGRNWSGGSTPISEEKLEPIFVPVGQTLVTIGDAVLVVVTGIIGIQYITASPDKKAKLKQQLIGLVVSIVVINGAVVIWQTVKNFMSGF